ncbi:hypothetical protein [Actinomadura hibisca]|uniref:hypothetical protein n=1 Tax=Actinomadura hibisca TaxID=68565 RepID=UPI000835286B|nr:hypothetical protein [Actinomadura hibisca]
MPVRSAAVLLLPLGASLLLPACGSDSDPASASAPPALTQDQARQVLSRYTKAAGQAGQRLDASGLSAVATGPQLTMDTAAVKLRRVTKQKPGPLAFTKPVFYIPRTTGYPRWFAADAISGSDKQTLRHALLFTQAKADAPWLLAADPYPSDAALSRVQLDGDGYATAVPPAAPGLSLAPGKVAAAHAALLTDGAKAPGAASLAPGPKTTQAREALEQGVKLLNKRGVKLTSSFTPDATPAYALRTKDGGAVVWYVLRQNEAYSSARRGTLSVSGDLSGLAPARTVRNRLTTTVLIQYLATVPPKGAATVTGMYRKAVAADGT